MIASCACPGDSFTLSQLRKRGKCGRGIAWTVLTGHGTVDLIQRSVGMHYVVVNGRVIYEDGRLTGELPGQVLPFVAPLTGALKLSRLSRLGKNIRSVRSGPLPISWSGPDGQSLDAKVKI
jgi:hypothetical protein